MRLPTYNVMMIERREGVAYRVGVGRISIQGLGGPEAGE